MAGTISTQSRHHERAPKAKKGPGGKKEAKVVYPSEFGSHQAWRTRN